jgi:thiol-disulfide isomerase/thioredoxin
MRSLSYALRASAIVWLVSGVPGSAEDRLPLLKVGSEIYSNVVVTSVTATDLYFNHAKGMSNAKLRNLDPDLQKRFGYSASKSGEAEVKQRIANTLFRVELASRAEAEAKAKADLLSSDAVSYDDGDPVVNKLYARSFRGRSPPQIMVEQWLTPPPNVEDKFVLVEFWASWADPCCQVIPHLNRLQAKFSNRLVVIGISDEPPEAIAEMKSPHLDYYVGTDTQARTRKAMAVEAIPHAILIDPKGIVRFEGVPDYLTEKDLAKLIEKYSE